MVNICLLPAFFVSLLDVLKRKKLFIKNNIATIFIEDWLTELKLEASEQLMKSVFSCPTAEPEPDQQPVPEVQEQHENILTNQSEKIESQDTNKKRRNRKKKQTTETKPQAETQTTSCRVIKNHSTSSLGLFFGDEYNSRSASDLAKQHAILEKTIFKLCSDSSSVTSLPSKKKHERQLDFEEKSSTVKEENSQSEQSSPSRIQSASCSSNPNEQQPFADETSNNSEIDKTDKKKKPFAARAKIKSVKKKIPISKYFLYFYFLSEAYKHHLR